MRPLRPTGRVRSGAALAIAMLCLGACAKPAPDPVPQAIPAKVVAGTTFTANPDPILTDGTGLGETTIFWSTTAKRTELRIGGPDGKLFGAGGPKGSAKTGMWVNNGMTFYLQNFDTPNPQSPDATLGVLTVVVQ